MTAGAFNLSLVIQDTETVGLGTGTARMFPNQGPLGLFGPTDQSSHTYNFDATLAGVPYSEFLFPDISQISPSVGSVAGGTVMTISGSGFSKNISRNLVYVGGEICTVTASDYGYIQCTTSPISPSSLTSFKQGIEIGTNGKPGDLLSFCFVLFFKVTFF